MEPLIYGDDTVPYDEEVNKWIRFGLRLGVSTAFHPFEYSKTLIQLGYEPIAATPGRTIFGRPIMLLPNIFQYAAYIRKVDGFYGWYRGLTPKLLGTILSTLARDSISERYKAANVNTKTGEGDDARYSTFKTALKQDIVLSVTGTVVAQPFYVISVRMMAQFIGRENIYVGIFPSIKEIYNNHGLAGFFSGLIPKLIAELSCLVLTSTTIYLYHKYVRNKTLSLYVSGIAGFFYSSALYPLQVVTACMAVTGSRLMAGQPPIMPLYSDWIHCWSDLQARGELNRGSSITRRTASVHKYRYEMGGPPMPTVTKYY